MARQYFLKRGNKYNAKATYRDGFRFDSLKEARFYDGLQALVAGGKLRCVLRQVPFHLSGDPPITYRCDFMTIDNDGIAEFYEVKGVWTDAARIKVAMVEKLYGVTINIR